MRESDKSKGNFQRRFEKTQKYFCFLKPFIAFATPLHILQPLLLLFYIYLFNYV